MRFSDNWLSALVKFKPTEAADEICRAYEDTDALWVATAEKLNVTTRTLHRWVERLNLKPRVAKIQAKKADIIASRQAEFGSHAGARPRRRLTFAEIAARDAAEAVAEEISSSSSSTKRRRTATTTAEAGTK